jgi:hypothetical protein
MVAFVKHKLSGFVYVMRLFGICITGMSQVVGTKTGICTKSTQCVTFKLAVPLYPVSQYTVCHIPACCSLVPVSQYTMCHIPACCSLVPVSQYTMCHIPACCSLVPVSQYTLCHNTACCSPVPVSQYTVCHITA